MKRTTMTLAVMCLSLLPAMGCRSKPAAVATPALVSAEAYDRVFDAAVQELRDMRFVVDRQDRRFGMIASRPRAVPTVVEPFQPDGASAGLAFESTLNHQRRIVHVHLRPPGTPSLETPAQVPSEYELNVIVFLERRSRPNIPLTTASLGRPSLLHGGRQDRRVITEQGPREAVWVAVDRDGALEGQITASILRRAQP